MCSIGGFIASRPISGVEAKNLCSALLWYGADRGMQSSGCFVNGKVHKAAVDPSDFIDSEEFKGMFGQPVRMALTHTRMPTSGGLGDDQAQPFRVGKTVTVHNGWIMNIKECREKYSLIKPSGVDSELFARFLAQYGVGRFGEFVEFAEGCAAVAAIHQGKMYLVRHNNPTFFCKLALADGGAVTVFGSTTEAVERAMAHTWLMPEKFFIQGTQQNVLLEVTPEKLRPIGDKLKPWGYGGVYRQYGGKYSDAYGWGEDDQAWVTRLIDR